MLVMYLFARGIDVGHVFVLVVSMLVIYLCVRDIHFGQVFVR
jgi:hypothetical protein